jgi:hypothetical protein
MHRLVGSAVSCFERVESYVQSLSDLGGHLGQGEGSRLLKGSELLREVDLSRPAAQEVVGS